VFKMSGAHEAGADTAAGARIQPLADGSEKRMFECPKCDLVETKTIADPPGSEPISLDGERQASELISTH